jgi:hypothetical protein
VAVSLYHPHVHMLVTAWGLRGSDQMWVAPRHAAFLVPGRALSRLFRGKVRTGLRKAGLLDHVPLAVWPREWVVHVQYAGTGEKVLEYLAATSSVSRSSTAALNASRTAR